MAALFPRGRILVMGVGSAVGLVWTAAGGDLIHIKVSVLPGSGKIVAKGRFGADMQDSLAAAVTVARQQTATTGVTSGFWAGHDVHICLPEGELPYDGPSAGVATCVAIVSAVVGVPIRSDMAMTGELSPLGEVLEVGGLEAKLHAAARAGLEVVLVPAANTDRLSVVSGASVGVVPIRWIDQAVAYALAMSEPSLGVHNG